MQILHVQNLCLVANLRLINVPACSIFNVAYEDNIISQSVLEQLKSP